MYKEYILSFYVAWSVVVAIVFILIMSLDMSLDFPFNWFMFAAFAATTYVLMALCAVVSYLIKNIR
jgi:hypothetical protein